MAEEAPPSFAASVEASEASLPPGYDDSSSRAQLTERVFTLETSKQQPWAFLKVKCPRGKPTSIPRFIQGEPITGTVELSLDKTEHIQAVTIEVRGDYLTVGQDPATFMSRETTLWSTSMGNPGATEPGDGNPKLKGEYVWPFSLTLPDTVAVSIVEKGPTTEYPLPPSFSEKASLSYLEYKVVVTFRRGKIRTDNILATPIAYHPRSRPSPASPLRQLAYRENTPLLGPNVDPEGWEVLGTKSVLGTVFKSRTAEVACVFSLAKPLCYTRGTSIPFCLTLSSSDRQAIDLCASHGSLSIYLMRTLRIGVGTVDLKKRARTDKKFVTRVGKGIYWPSEDNSVTLEARKITGEIPLAVDLKPSFVFPRLSVAYHVTLELTPPGFTVTSDDAGSRDPLFSCEVEIATVLPLGPIPRSRVPATHEESEPLGDYGVSIALLSITGY